MYSAHKQIPSQTVADSSTGMNRFAPYFGQATSQPNLVMDPYRKRSYDHFALPDAYAGRNYFLGSVIETAVMSEDSFYTQVLLPLRQVSEGGVPARGVSWNKWHFDSHFADVLPEETPASLITSRRESRSRSFVRRGKAFTLEHGFMQTAEGQEAYRRNLEQMVNLVAETGNFDVVYELLNVDVGEREWTARYGYVRQEGVRQAIDSEKQRWAILQKTKNGFEKMDAQIKQDMRRRQGRADTWILHENMMTHLNLVPPEKTDQYLAGERGPSNVSNYDATQPIAYLNGNIRVYLSRSFAVGDYNQEIDPWMRERQIGEYFLMASEYQHNADVSDYNSEEMSPAVYDEYSDDYAILSIQSAIQHTVLFDSLGHMRTPQKQFDAPNWDEDIKIDPFVKSSGTMGVNAIEVWGEMHHDYLPTDGVMRIARSAIRTLAARYTQGESEISTIMRNGLNSIRVIDARPLNADYVEALQKANNETVSHIAEDVRFAKSNVQRIFKVDPSTGSFALPDLSAGKAKESALVGFANYPGLNAVRQANSRGALNAGYDAQEIDRLVKFVDLVDHLVAIGKQLFPGSIFLDERFTAPQYVTMSAESVLMDNLMGTLKQSMWMAKTTEENRTGFEDKRLQADDIQLRESIYPTAKQIGNIDGDDFSGDTKTLFGAANGQEDGTKFPIPSATATGADKPYEKHEARIILSELYRQLNVFDGGQEGIKAAKAFLKDAAVDGRTIDQILANAEKNYKLFQTDSSKAWKAAVERLRAGLADAKKADAGLGTGYGVAFYGDGAADTRVPIQVQYGGEVPEQEQPGAYYRTPLDLSPAQILKLAERPNALPVTVSRLDSKASVGASTQELRMIARKIKEAGRSAGQLNASPILSSFYQNQDLGHLGRTVIAHTVKERRSNAMDANASMGNYSAQKRMREELSERVTDKRRKLTIAGAGGRSAGTQAQLDFYGGYDSAPLGSDTAQSRMVANGNDGIDGGAGNLSEIHDRLGEHFRKVDRSTASDVVRLLGKLFLGTAATRQSLATMAANNVVLPLVFMAARPHMRYNMRMGIKMLAGSATGNTFIGQSWFELSDDSQKQMHHADYRYWSKSVVTEEKNVYLAFDMFAQEGLGGAGVQPIPLDVYDPAASIFGRDREDSLFYIPLPYSSGIQGADNRQQLPDTMDLSGRFLHYKVLGAQDKEKLMRLHYPTSARMNGHIGWRTEEAYGSVPLYDTYHPWRFEHDSDTVMHYNTSVCKGHQKQWDRNTKKRSISKRNTGHWGKLTTPGCAAIRNGGLMDYTDIVAY